jgi:hypothetical protein
LGMSKGGVQKLKVIRPRGSGNPVPARFC